MDYPVTILILLFVMIFVFGEKSEPETTYQWPVQGGTVHFNNPKLLSQKIQQKTELWKSDTWLQDLRQEKIDSVEFGGIMIKRESKTLAHQLRMLTDQELGVKNMQRIFDTMHYLDSDTSEEKKLLELSKRLETKFHQYLRVLKSNKQTVENLYRFHVKVPITMRYDCCNLPMENLVTDTHYESRVSTAQTCDLVPQTTPYGAFNPGRNLTQVFQHNVQYFPNLKWQYFISADNIHNEYPAHNFHSAPIHCQSMHDTRHRDVFISTVSPQRKHVVIVVDHGNSMSQNQLSTARAISKHLLLSLSPNDRVGIIGLSAHIVSPGGQDDCLSNNLVPLTHEVKFQLRDFVNNLNKIETTTNHTLGFEYAFKMIENSLAVEDNVNDETMILYVSRGLLSSLTVAKDVMMVISKQNGRLGHRVVINTYAVIDHGKPIMYETSFLENIAHQNYDRYDVPRFSSMPIRRGEMWAINSTVDLASTVGRFYETPYSLPAPHTAQFSLPHLDIAGRGLVISISQACFFNDEVIGIVGIDLHLGDMVEDVTYYENDKSSYAFVMSTLGYAIMHPAMPRPINSETQPYYTDVSQLENYPLFAAIQGELEQEAAQHLATHVKGNNSEYNVSGGGTESMIKYLWKQVPGLPIIVCIKVLNDSVDTRTLTDVPIADPPDIVYHRLDLVAPDGGCMHLKSLSTIEVSTMYLSPSSFNDPFNHLIETETKKMITGYLAYLQDTTKLITNPGLKLSIRDDAAAISRINAFWMEQFTMSDLNSYIVRKYVATPSGVLRMFPGTLLDKRYDPSKRPWYKRALANPGHVTLTSPYLDAGGAGYIVTISHAVYEGNADSQHSASDSIAAVMGMDVTLKFMYKLLVHAMPACDLSSLRCFIFDDRGYLISHPGVIEPRNTGPVEQKHITHMEPLVANDILNHRHFVRKTLCNSYTDRTVQRYYHFNTSLDGVLSNLVHGEHCAKYQIARIPGTNAFMGIVNQTCQMVTAFCPCSMVDRLCLNCKRMEQNECECPCECPMDMDYCQGTPVNENQHNPSCSNYPEQPKLAVVPPSVRDDLVQCFNPRCNERKTKEECFGVVDCEWCQIDTDGVTLLQQPHCATQRVCFGGVYGALSPYRDEIKLLAMQDEQTSVRTTPVGPVAGAFMGAFLVLALGVYCYKHHVHRHSHHYISSSNDNARGSQMDNDIDDADALDEPGAGIVLASFENAAVSPYRMNINYRRPTGGESDHGYSTMTPHEDSEQASTTCAESFVGTSRDRYRPFVSPMKVTPLPPPPNNRASRQSADLMGPSTVLPSSIPESSFPHHIVTSAEVHVVSAQ